jgi:molybdopterin molybdotransferase
MLLVNQAEAIVLDLASPLGEQDIELVSLPEAAQRVLAKPIISLLDFPHWDNSAMDGYAVRYADVQHCSAEQPITLKVVEEIPAGATPQRSLQPRETARILTGSMLPVGADTIVIQEEVERSGDQITLWKAPIPQAFVRRRGSFYQAGQPLLPAGIRLQAPDLAVLAAAQCNQIPVYRRLRVAILSTGNELVRWDQPLQPGQIVDSNQHALSALVAQSGAVPVPMGIIPDNLVALKQAMAQAVASADVVLSSGGVSVGDYDYVDKILAESGAEIHLRAVAVKPGKPLTVATFTRLGQSSVLYFGLPGNPVSALVSFWRFVHPALTKRSGLLPPWQPVFLSARTQQDLRADGKRETYLWGQLQATDGQLEFIPAAGGHNSGNLINLSQTTGLAVVPLGQTHITAGEFVQVLQVGAIKPGLA